MADKGSNGSSTIPAEVAAQVAAPPGRRRTPWPFIALAILFVVVPFLTWYLTWFGRPLSDADIERYLNDEKSVRHVQQALTQIEERIEKGDESVKRFYPKIVALVHSPVTEIRKTAAWVMGQDNKSVEFHNALKELLTDAQPVVRRNAAVQLVRFADTSGRGELRATLQPYQVNAPVGGTLSSVLTEGATVRENALVARITDDRNEIQEVRSPLPGELTNLSAREGVRVAAGENILSIAPDPDFVYEALRALLFVGEAEDLPEVERYARGVEGMPARVQQQAAQTAKAIQSRSGKK
jgi:biotin carboxyl carrier protein